MEYGKEDMVWALVVEIYHGPSYGHRLNMHYGRTGFDHDSESLGTWKGLGIPRPVLQEAIVKIDSLFTEYICWRYGVAEELPLKWAGDPGPF